MLLTEVQGPGRAWGDTFAGLGNQVLSELYGVRNEEYDTVHTRPTPTPDAAATPTEHAGHKAQYSQQNE